MKIRVIIFSAIIALVALLVLIPDGTLGNGFLFVQFGKFTLQASNVQASQRKNAENGNEKFDFNQLFLDFLIANTRDRFERTYIEPSPEVVVIEFNEKDKAEFSAWPPAPLDYIILLKRIAKHEPDVVVMGDVLKWDKADVPFLGELQESFRQFPLVALAFGATIDGTAKDSPEIDAEDLPVFKFVQGDASSAPKLGSFVLPEKQLRTQMELGFVASSANEKAEHPSLLVARAGQKLVPSLDAQMIALKEHTPYAEQRLRFGIGAGLHLGGRRFVPLANDGTVKPRLKSDPIRINAIDLLTPDLGDDTGRALAKKLGKHKLIILGTTTDSSEPRARIAAWALALPTLHRAPAWMEWTAAGAALLLAFVQLRFRRFKAVAFGACVLALGLAAAIVSFQSTLTWCAPHLALALTLTGSVFCFLWPASRRVVAMESAT